MAPPQQVWLVGVDGSAGAEHALRWSLARAKNRAARISAVQVWQPYMSGALDLGGPIAVEDAVRAAQAVLDDLAERIGETAVPVRWSVESGGVSRVLLDLSAEADLVVVGTRGRGGFKRLLLGSVSHQCATHSRVPIVVVPPTAKLDTTTEHVVVGMDGSDNAKAALRWALEFAPAGCTIRVVGAWELSPAATVGDLRHPSELTQEAKRRFEVATDDVVSSMSSEATIVRQFQYGQPAKTVLDADEQADLIVVGARGRGTIGAAILGSTSTRILHESAAAVVVVPARTD
jgi:nucleotide-binding universal stress UspA family protein